MRINIRRRGTSQETDPPPTRVHLWNLLSADQIDAISLGPPSKGKESRPSLCLLLAPQITGVGRRSHHALAGCTGKDACSSRTEKTKILDIVVEGQPSSGFPDLRRRVGTIG
jgi:hypothetical protein